MYPQVTGVNAHRQAAFDSGSKYWRKLERMFAVERRAERMAPTLIDTLPDGSDETDLAALLRDREPELFAARAITLAAQALIRCEEAPRAQRAPSPTNIFETLTTPPCPDWMRRYQRCRAGKLKITDHGRVRARAGSIDLKVQMREWFEARRWMSGCASALACLPALPGVSGAVR